MCGFIEMMPIGYGKQFKTINRRSCWRRCMRAYPGLCEEDDGVHGYGPAVLLPDTRRLGQRRADKRASTGSSAMTATGCCRTSQGFLKTLPVL
ncbi:MAG: hypothetical protein ACLTW9_25045 [Enterocloster sp.]